MKVKLKTHLKLEIVLLVFTFAYYLFFVNKGLVFFDEGYFVHSAERVFNGEIPYKDFSLQYGPTFFYILAVIYKIFGQSILVGRFLSLFICIGILIANFLILKKLKIRSFLIIILSTLSLVSFGYPLINIPNIIWLNVLLSFLLVLTFMHWVTSNKYLHLIIMGIILALSVSAKQNFGISLIFLYTPLVMFIEKKGLIQTAKNIVILNGTWIGLTFSWVYYFFLRNNMHELSDFINFSKSFAVNTAFSYPPLTYLLQPLGFFKLLPYYTPIILLIAVIIFLFRKYRNLSVLAFSLTAVIGFFVSVYPQSDLLHCYPFLGMVLVSFLLLPFKRKSKAIIAALVLVTIFTGFYLSIFTKSYRYEDYYYNYNTRLNLPRTQGILVAKSTAENVEKLYAFINKETKKQDYIFAYPYSPMLYFILERNNPSKDALYFLRMWHFYDDKVIISEIMSKHVKYIITDGNYKFGTDLSKFIDKQKQVFSAGQFQVFKIL